MPEDDKKVRSTEEKRGTISAGSDSSDLLACPFCGGTPAKQWIPQSMALPGITRGGFSIVCQSCFCVCLVGGCSESDAIEHWQHRVS